MDNTPDSIYIKDRDCRLLRVSRSMARRLGYIDPAEVIGKTDIDLFGEAFGQRTFLEDRRIMDSGEPLVGLVESRPLGDAHVNWTLTTKLPLRDATGATVGLIGITREINEIKRTELDLQHLATHDTLTGLPNRYLMMDRLSQVLAHSKRAGTSFAVLFLDIDDFKAINDDHGHDFGDLVLQTMARRLVTIVRASDTVARIGGDEFVIILEVGGARRRAGRGRQDPESPGPHLHRPGAQDQGDGQHRDQLLPRQRRRCRGAGAGGRLRHVPGQAGRQEPLADVPARAAGRRRRLRDRLTFERPPSVRASAASGSGAGA